MSRSQRRSHSTDSDLPASVQRPITKEQDIRETRYSCRSGGCADDAAALDAAYERYVNDPHAPWNKQRRRARSRRDS